MGRSETPSPEYKRYAWECDRSPERRPTQGYRKGGRRSPSADRKRYSPSYSPPARHMRDRRSDSRQNRRRDRSCSRRRGRSRSLGKGKGKNSNRVCVEFIAKGCRLGDKCSYRHPDEDERRRLEDVFASQPCKMGAKCTRPHCVYMHPGRPRRRARSSSSERSRSFERIKIPMMKAVGLKSYGELSMLEDIRVPKLRLDAKSKDLLVCLQGCDAAPFGNKASEDRTTRMYQVSGSSFAGVIEEMSEGASASGKFKVGDAVWFANTWEPVCGSYQEYCLVDYRAASLKPKRLTSFADAASIPSVALTVWGALMEQMSMDYHLFQGGVRLPKFTPENKGVFLALPGGCAAGAFALQLAARYLNRNKNLVVIASASRPEAIEWCKTMGADHVIDQQAFSFREELDKLGIDGLDFVFYGMPPSQHEEKLYAVMNPLGQIASYHEGKFENTDACLSKWISIHRESIESRKMLPDFRKANGEVLATVARLFDDASIKLESVATKKFSELTAETVRQADAWQSLRSIDAANAMGNAVFEIK